MACADTCPYGTMCACPYTDEEDAVDDFTVKDSGQRLEFDSGMRRDVTEGKVLWSLIYSGPMLERWAKHLTAGAEKYGPNNWLLAQGQEELDRFRDSAARHFAQWMRGDRDEDHGAAVFFNINGAEYVRDRMNILNAVAQERAIVDDEAAVKRLMAGTDTEPVVDATGSMYDPETGREVTTRDFGPLPEDNDPVEVETVSLAQALQWGHQDGIPEAEVRSAMLDMLRDGDAVLVGIDPVEGPVIAHRLDLERAGLIHECDCSPDIYRLAVTDPDSPVTGRTLLGSYSKCNEVWYAFPPGTDPRSSGLVYELTNEQVEIGAHVAASLEELLTQEG